MISACTMHESAVEAWECTLHSKTRRISEQSDGRLWAKLNVIIPVISDKARLLMGRGIYGLRATTQIYLRRKGADFSSSHLRPHLAMLNPGRRWIFKRLASILREGFAIFSEGFLYLSEADSTDEKEKADDFQRLWRQIAKPEFALF